MVILSQMGPGAPREPQKLVRSRRLYEARRDIQLLCKKVICVRSRSCLVSSPHAGRSDSFSSSWLTSDIVSLALRARERVQIRSRRICPFGPCRPWMAQCHGAQGCARAAFTSSKKNPPGPLSRESSPPWPALRNFSSPTYLLYPRVQLPDLQRPGRDRH